MHRYYSENRIHNYEGKIMPYINVGQENSAPIELYYEDQGSGDPILLIHGWPLSGASWEKQTSALLEAGYRVISYDRRGFGLSSKPSIGYDYDTFTEDLNLIITELELENLVLAGFSMGTGEVARYLGKYGSDKINKVIMIGVIPPYLLKTKDNPSGVEQSVFDDMKKGLVKDRPAFLLKFLHDFYNFDVLKKDRISEEVLQSSWNVAVVASAVATLKCVDTWTTDFRSDIEKFDIPTLIIHGNKDRILPFKSTAVPLSEKLKEAQFVEINGGPHGLIWTHAEEVNQEILKFLSQDKIEKKTVASKLSKQQQQSLQ